MLQNRETLHTLMGLWGDDIDWEAVSDLPDLPGEQMELTQLENQVIDNSLDLIVTQQKMKAVAAQMDIDTAELVFPEMATGAEAEREGDGTWSVGPVFSVGVPIFDFGQARTAAGKGH